MDNNIFQLKSWGFLEPIASSLLLSEYEFEKKKSRSSRWEMFREPEPHLDHVQPVGGEVGPVNTNQVQQHLQ